MTSLIKRRQYFRLLTTFKFQVSLIFPVVFLYLDYLLTLEPLIVFNCYNPLLSVRLFIILFLYSLFVCGIRCLVMLFVAVVLVPLRLKLNQFTYRSCVILFCLCLFFPFFVCAFFPLFFFVLFFSKSPRLALGYGTD